MGNAYDLASLAALILGGLVLFSCATWNCGLCCLPLLSIALGAAGLLTADRSRDPSRTRIMSWIGLGSGVVVLLLFLVVAVVYGDLILALISLGKLD